MNTKRRPRLNGVILLALLAGLVSGAVEKSEQATTNFYAYYTRLDYQQPQDPALLGRIPVNATKGLPAIRRTAPTKFPGHPSRDRSAGDNTPT